MDKEDAFESSGNEAASSEALAPEPTDSAPALCSAACAVESERNMSLAVATGDDTAPSAWNKRALPGIFPPEVWNLILDMASPMAQYILRQSSRFFFHLIYDYRVRQWSAETPIRPATQPFNVTGMDERRALKLVMERQVFCGPCLAFRQSGAYDRKMEDLSRSLYCNSCKKDHPALLFPGRLRRDPDKRVCIGREGSIPLCDHNIQLRWNDVADLSSYSCADGSHLDCSPDHRPFLPTAEVVCAPKHRGAVEWDYLPVLKCVRVKWKTCVFELSSCDEHITQAMLQEKMHAFAKRVSCKLCPHLSFHNSSLLRPLDPVYCNCIGEVPSLHHSPRLCGTGLSDMKNCCLCQEWWESSTGSQGVDDGGSEGGRALGDASAGCSGGTEEPKKTSNKHDEEAKPPKAFLALNKGGAQFARHCGSCTDCNASYRWSREGWDSRRIVLTYEWEVGLRLDEPTELEWVAALDPESYGRDTDEDGKHVFWCDDAACATGYKGRGHARALKEALEAFKARKKQELVVRGPRR